MYKRQVWHLYKNLVILGNDMKINFCSLEIMIKNSITADDIASEIDEIGLCEDNLEFENKTIQNIFFLSTYKKFLHLITGQL